MKIKTADIEPNPYRKIDDYPIDESKVAALVNSIKEKTFWDNILVRPHPTKKDKFQLAYGHHRHVALQRLKIDEVDIPCRDIEDAVMIQIMAEENLNWSTAPTVMVQTIQAAKDFIDGELAKYDELATSPEIWRCLFSSQRSFAETKTKGAGEPTITKFLGGNWTKHKVSTALNIIKDKSLDSEAVKIIPTMEQAHVFRTEVKKHDIPKKTQQKLAKTIKKEGVGKRDIPDLVAQHSLKPTPKSDPKPKPMLDDYANETIKLMGQVFDRLHHIKGNTKNIRLTATRNELRLTTEELIVKLKQIQKELEHEQEEKKKAIDSKVG